MDKYGEIAKGIDNKLRNYRKKNSRYWSGGGTAIEEILRMNRKYVAQALREAVKETEDALGNAHKVFGAESDQLGQSIKDLQGKLAKAVTMVKLLRQRISKRAENEIIGSMRLGQAIEQVLSEVTKDTPA